MHPFPTNPPVPSHREQDTFRGLVQDGDVAVPEEQKARSTAMLVGVVGVLLGCIVGVVALRNADGPSQAPAAAAVMPMPMPVPVPVAATIPPSPIVAPAGAASPTGTVDVDGPAGAQVFDGDRFVGKIPLTFSTSLGEHVLRIEDPATKRAFVAHAVVSETTVAAVRVDTRKHGRVNTHVSTGITTPVVGTRRHAESTSGRPSASDIAAAQTDLAAARNANTL